MAGDGFRNWHSSAQMAYLGLYTEITHCELSLGVSVCPLKKGFEKKATSFAGF
jgi:hypothetical protein